MMTAIFGACAEHARARSADRVLIMGKIHVNNRPSQLMVERVGFEPADAPTADYQTWLRLLSVIN